jgi:hypothetical protein
LDTLTSMATPRERAVNLLHVLRERQRVHVGHFGPDRPSEQGRIAGTIGALRAVGLLSADEASLAMTEAAELRASDPDASEEAVRLLSGLLDAVVREGDGEGMVGHRFQGALEALADVGLADADEWDRRLRKRTGRPSAAEEWQIMREMNAGGTEQELVAVVPGSTESADGLVVLYALRFTDGISFTCVRVVDEDCAETDKPRRDLWDWDLRDDLGTVYRGGSFGGSDREQHATFITPPPLEASWVELVNPAGHAIRLAL